MTTASRLSMPLGEAIFSLRAIRRLKPDPIPDALSVTFWRRRFGPQTWEHPAMALLVVKDARCARSLAPCTMKPGGRNGGTLAYTGLRICPQLPSRHAYSR